MNKIVVGILNYNMPDMTDKLVKRLKEIIKVPVEYVVFDNGSDKAKPPKTVTHLSDVNHQSVNGYNRILKIARDMNSDYVWILTNDTFFDADTDPVEAMINACDDFTAIVHPAISNTKSDNKWFEHMSYENAKSGIREIDRHIDYICPMFTKKFLDLIDWKHDEKLISWGADIESCHYAWLNKMKVIICHDVIVRHELSAAIKAGMTDYNNPSEFYNETQKNMREVFKMKFGSDWNERLGQKNFNHHIDEWNPKIGAIYKVFQGNEFFEASLHSIYNWVDKIVISSSEVNWVGEEGNDCLETAQNWKLKYDVYDKVIIHHGHYTNQDDQQTAGWNIVRNLGLDYCMIIDSDEVYDEENLVKFWNHVRENPNFSSYCARNHTFIKSPYFMVYPDEPFRGVVMLNGKETGIHGARCARNTPMYLMDDVYFWHFNAVRKDEKIALKKFETSLTGDGVKNFSLTEFYKKWNELPNSNNFHPHNGFEHWWQNIVLIKNIDLPKIVRNLPVVKQFKEPTDKERNEHNMRIMQQPIVMVNQALQTLDTRPRLTIVIPAAGKGTRMNSKIPKPFIECAGKYVIDWAIMSAAFPQYRCHFVVIINSNFRGVNYNKILSDSVRKLHIGATIEIVKGDPHSQLESVLLARNSIRAASELLITNCDQFALYSHTDFINTVHSLKIDGALVCHNSDSNAYSYVQPDREGLIEKIVEKEVISDIATSGYYYWKNPKEFLKYADEAMKIDTGKEHYVSESYAMSLKDKKKHYCYVIQEKNFHDMGTEKKLIEFINYVETSKIYRKKLDILIA